MPSSRRKRCFKPVYEYLCERCDKGFELVLTLHEHEEQKVVCPKCGSNEVHQMLTAFTAVRSKIAKSCGLFQRKRLHELLYH